MFSEELAGYVFSPVELRVARDAYAAILSRLEPEIDAANKARIARLVLVAVARGRGQDLLRNVQSDAPALQPWRAGQRPRCSLVHLAVF